MEKALQKAFFAAIAVTVIALLCGCKNIGKNTDNQNILISDAVNVDYINGRYELTVQGLSPGGALEKAGKSSEKGEEAAERLFYAEGKSLAQAFDSLSLNSGKRILTAHNQIILLGKQAVENNMTESVSFFAFNNELPIEASVYGIKNGNSDNIGDAAKLQTDGSIAKAINDINAPAKSNMRSVDQTVLGIMTKTYGGLSDIALPVISIQDGNFKCDGTAVYRDGVFCGYINTDETMFLSLINNNGKGGGIDTGNIYYNITDYDTDWSVNYVNKIPYVSLDVNVYADINYVKKGVDTENDKSEKILADYLKKGLNSLFYKLCREYKSDVLGITNRFSLKYPREFRKYKNNRFELLEKAVFDFNIHITIENADENGMFPVDYN